MKRLVVFTVFVMMIGFNMGSSVFARNIKIGYADALKIFNGYTKTQNYEKALNNKKKKTDRKSVV